MKKILSLLAVVLILPACAHGNASLSHSHDFKTYKTAYIKILPEDEFNISAYIIRELSDLGVDVKIKAAPENPVPTDMLVNYSYERGYDYEYGSHTSIYLKSFQIFLLDAQDGSVVANLSYYQESNTPAQRKVESAFDDLRKKANLPVDKNGSKVSDFFTVF